MNFNVNLVTAFLRISVVTILPIVQTKLMNWIAHQGSLAIVKLNLLVNLIQVNALMSVKSVMENMIV